MSKLLASFGRSDLSVVGATKLYLFDQFAANCGRRVLTHRLYEHSDTILDNIGLYITYIIILVRKSSDNPAVER